MGVSASYQKGDEPDPGDRLSRRQADGKIVTDARPGQDAGRRPPIADGDVYRHGGAEQRGPEEERGKGRQGQSDRVVIRVTGLQVEIRPLALAGFETGGAPALAPEFDFAQGAEESSAVVAR